MVTIPVCLCGVEFILLCGLLTGCLRLTSAFTSFCPGDQGWEPELELMYSLPHWLLQDGASPERGQDAITLIYTTWLPLAAVPSEQS